MTAIRRFLRARTTRPAAILVGIACVALLAGWAWAALHPFDRDDFVVDELPAALSRHGVEVRPDAFENAPTAAAEIEKVLGGATRIRGPLSLAEDAAQQLDGGPDFMWGPTEEPASKPVDAPGAIISVDVLIGLAWTSHIGEAIVSYAVPDDAPDQDFLYAIDLDAVRRVGDLLYVPVASSPP